MAKILLVEDNEMSRDMLARRLTRSGFEIATAEDGRQGIDQAALHSPDLILMDLNLPVMDGWEATRQLKAAPATREIPIVALTAHAMAGDQHKALQAGCDDYMTKPVDFPSLVAKINKLLSIKAAT